MPTSHQSSIATNDLSLFIFTRIWFSVIRMPFGRRQGCVGWYQIIIAKQRKMTVSRQYNTEVTAMKQEAQLLL